MQKEKDTKQVKKVNSKKFVRYKEGAELYSISIFGFRQPIFLLTIRNFTVIL